MNQFVDVVILLSFVVLVQCVQCTYICMYVCICMMKMCWFSLVCLAFRWKKHHEWIGVIRRQRNLNGMIHTDWTPYRCNTIWLFDVERVPSHIQHRLSQRNREKMREKKKHTQTFKKISQKKYESWVDASISSA